MLIAFNWMRLISPCIQQSSSSRNESLRKCMMESGDNCPIFFQFGQIVSYNNHTQFLLTVFKCSLMIQNKNKQQINRRWQHCTRKTPPLLSGVSILPHLNVSMCVGYVCSAALSPCVHPYTSISDLSVGVVLYLADSLHAYTGEVNLNNYLNIPNEWPYCRYEWLYKPVQTQTYLETCSWYQQPTNTLNHTRGWVWPKRGWRLERGEGR